MRQINQSIPIHPSTIKLGPLLPPLKIPQSLLEFFSLFPPVPAPARRALHLITSGHTAFRLAGGTAYMSLSHLARAHAELGHVDDAWRCIGEAMTAIETTKEKVVRDRGQSHRRRSRAAVARAGRCESASVFRPRTNGRACAAGQILRAARRDEPRAPLARPGQGAGSSRTVGSGLRLVHGRVRYARSERSQSAARRTSVIRLCPRRFISPHQAWKNGSRVTSVLGCQ